MAYKEIGTDMRGNKITLEQEEEVVRLYRSRKYSIKKILSLTGIGSEQTVYRILAGRDNIEMIRRTNPAKKLCVNLDAEAAKCLKKANPKNVSEWISNCIKKATTKV